MLTQHKLPKGVKDLFIERLGEVETQLVKPQVRPIITAQAPSTIAALERQINEPIPPPMPILPTQRVIGGNVNNGDGTIGKRKF
jgi:hypothetical protein